MKKRRLAGTLGWAFLVLIVSATSGLAYNFQVGGKPVDVLGYVSQQVDYGLARDKWDAQSGFNSFLTTALLEVGMDATDNVRLFASGSFEADWAYRILDGNQQWNDKEFNESKENQYIRNDWQDLLKEAHVTYFGENVFLRLGKQVVQWGETDGLLLANLINPVDQRRGPTDVKFEHTIIPIWLVRAEYNKSLDSTFMQEFGAQFIFDPAFHWRGNQVVTAGNDAQGVFAPNLPVDFGPLGVGHVGSLNSSIDEPDNLDPHYFSYGLKLRANVHDTLVNLLYFNGTDRDFAAHDLPIPPDNVPLPPTFAFTPNEFDGTPVIHPYNEGYYPDFKFVGLTVSGAFENLKASFLGGVAPVFRLETIYAFDTTYGTNEAIDPDKYFWKTDEWRSVLGIDWKVKVDWLNPRAYFFLTGQFFYQKEMDFPDSNDVANQGIPGLEAPLMLYQRGTVPDGPFREDWSKFSLVATTSYLHNKLVPFFFWSHGFTFKDNMYIGKLTYSPTQSWDLTLGGVFFGGKLEGEGNRVMTHKDKLFTSVTYKFQ